LKNRIRVVVLSLFIVMLTALNRNTAHADATLISYSLTCSSLTATGTTTTGILGLDVQIGVGGLPIGIKGFAASGPTATGTLTFPEQPAGTVLTILVYSATDLQGSYDGTALVTVQAPCSGGAGAAPFTDGRLNNYDAGQTAAIYCEDQGITVYGFYKGISFIAFKASKAEIAAVPEKPAQNTKIKQGHGITLWRLSSGEFQINAPDGYVFKWSGNCTI
jgi:hypothetical protein